MRIDARVDRVHRNGADLRVRCLRSPPATLRKGEVPIRIAFSSASATARVAITVQAAKTR